MRDPAGVGRSPADSGTCDEQGRWEGLRPHKRKLPRNGPPWHLPGLPGLCMEATEKGGTGLPSSWVRARLGTPLARQVPELLPLGRGWSGHRGKSIHGPPGCPLRWAGAPGRCPGSQAQTQQPQTQDGPASHLHSSARAWSQGAFPPTPPKQSYLFTLISCLKNVNKITQ